VVQIVGTVGLVGYLSFKSGQKSVEDIAHQLMEQVGERVSDRVTTYLQSPQTAVAANHLAVQQGTLNINDFEQLRQQFWQQLTLNPSLEALYFGNESGEEIGYGRFQGEETIKQVEKLTGEDVSIGTPHISILRSTDPGKRKYYLVDSKGNPRKLFYTFPIDNHTTLWYRTAKASNQQTWSPISVYKVIPLLGLFAVTPIYDEVGKWQGVFASSFTLSSISTFLDRLDFSPSGQVFIMERSGKLVATSTQESLLVKPTKGEATQLLAVNSKDSRTRDIAQQLANKFGNFRTIQTTQQLTLVSNREHQFVQVTPYTDKYGLDWLIVTVVPESDFTEQIHANTRTTILLCIAALICSIGIGFIAADWITQPIVRLNRAAKDIAKGEWEKTVDVNRTDEVGQLSQSFNQMAAQLQQYFAELRASNQSLAESESKLNQILEAMPVGISVHDSTGKVIYANQSAKQLFRVETIPEVEAEQLAQVYQVYQAGTKQLYPVKNMPASRSLQGERVRADDLEIRFPDRTIPIEVYSTPLLDETGKIIGAIAAFFDITERQNAQKILADYNRTLETEVAQKTEALRCTNEQLQLEIVDRKLAEQETRLLLSTTQAISQAEDIESALKNILRLICQYIGWDFAEAWIPDAESKVLEYSSSWCKSEDTLEDFRKASATLTFALGMALPGRIWLSRQPEWISDVSDSKDSIFYRVQLAINAGLKAGFGVPIVDNNRVLAVLMFFKRSSTVQEPRVVELVSAVAAQLSALIRRKQVETALQASQHRYQTLTETSPICIFQTDTSGHCNYVNQRWSEITGLSFEESLNLGWASILHPDDRDRVFAEWFAAVAARVPCKSEFRFLCPDGKIIWVICEALPEVGQDGEIIGYVGTVTDISDRKLAETALRESQEQLQLALEGSGDGLWDWNIQTGEVYFSPRYLEMLGYDANELPQAFSTWERLIHPDDKPWVMERLNAHLADSSIPYQFDYRILTKSGTWKWIANYGKVVARDEKGTPLRMTGTHRDVSERKRAEEALRESEQRYLGIIEDQTELIVRFFPDGTLSFVNEAYCRYFGITREQLSGHRFEPLIVEEDREHVNRLIKSLSLEHPVVAIEQRVIVKKKVRWMQWINRALFDGQDNIIELQAVGRDITDNKQAEFALQQAKEIAETTNQAKSTFLANMSHELRTPLNAILGFARLMANSPTLPPEQQERVKIINRSGEHLLTLINDVLDLAKIEANRTTLNEQDFNLYKLLADVEQMFFMKAQTKGLQLRVDRDDTVPKYVRIDEVKLRQVLLNLLSNAIKFTKTGGVFLNVKRESDADYCRLKFEVSDTGAGIAPDELDSIFEPFVQSSTGKQSIEGTGLGLPISRAFVQLMGGDITVRSAVGEGSTFSFAIPITVVESTLLTTQQPTRRVIALEPNQPCYRILIVDDKEDNRQLLVQLLSPLGFALKEASNGREAIEIWQHC
jgi:PAS domain S-box-containing protein